MCKACNHIPDSSDNYAATDGARAAQREQGSVCVLVAYVFVCLSIESVVAFDDLSAFSRLSPHHCLCNGHIITRMICVSCHWEVHIDCYQQNNMSLNQSALIMADIINH